MLDALYLFFYDLFQGENVGNFTEGILFNIGAEGGDMTSLYLSEYLALLCSIISLIIILVLCCLFVYKIIKLIGGLIR